MRNFEDIQNIQVTSKSGNLSTWEQNLLKNMHLEIPISFILDNILYSPKTLTLYPEPYMVTLLKSTRTPDRLLVFLRSPPRVLQTFGSIHNKLLMDSTRLHKESIRSPP